MQALATFPLLETIKSQCQLQQAQSRVLEPEPDTCTRQPDPRVAPAIHSFKLPGPPSPSVDHVPDQIDNSHHESSRYPTNIWGKNGQPCTGMVVRSFIDDTGRGTLSSDLIDEPSKYFSEFATGIINITAIPSALD